MIVHSGYDSLSITRLYNLDQFLMQGKLVVQRR